MTGCKWPQHHESGRSGAGLLAVMVAAAVIYAARHLIAEILIVAGVVVLALAAAAVVVLAARLVVCRRRGALLNKRAPDLRKRGTRPGLWLPRNQAGQRPSWLRHVPRAVWAAARWHHLTRNLVLAYPDRHARGKVRRPRAVVLPSRHGVVAWVRTVPGSGRAEFDKAAESIGDCWRVQRVSVTRPKPGRLRVAGLRVDPLLEPLPAAVLPPGWDGRHVVLGRDEYGSIRTADLANLSGSAFSGAPGRGKTEAALSLACQLAVSPLADTWILDGGACDWAPFAAGAAGYVGDDLGAAEDMLRVLDALMCERRRNLQADRGTRNGWSSGPAPDYRLQWVLVEEAPFYLDLDAVKGDRARETQVRACRGLLAGLLRRGRAPLLHTTLIAQKGTGTGGLPPDLRDLCGLRWSFGLPTVEASAAILGDDIRRHETMSPTLLQEPAYTGVASVLLRTAQSPYTLVRFPAIGQARADAAAAALAARAAVPDNAAELTGSPA